MSKRFTDSEKWKKAWFRKLTDKAKLFWIYILDTCSVAGVWEVDFEMAKFFIGEFDIENIKIEVSKQYKESKDGKFWFIVDFVDFQYGKLTEHPFHKKIKKEIDTLSNRVSNRVSNTLKEKEKDKEIEKDKDKEKDKEDSIKGVIGGIINDLNEVLGTSYKITSHKTNELIQARLNEGFTLEDFKTVHRNMFKRWGADNKMREFLRPITLYSNKFESYLNVKQELPISTEGAKAIMAGKSWLGKKEVIDVRQE